MENVAILCLLLFFLLFIGISSGRFCGVEREERLYHRKKIRWRDVSQGSAPLVKFKGYPWQTFRYALKRGKLIFFPVPEILMSALRMHGTVSKE